MLGISPGHIRALYLTSVSLISSLTLNGITATQEMYRLKDKATR